MAVITERASACSTIQTSPARARVGHTQEGGPYDLTRPGPGNPSGGTGGQGATESSGVDTASVLVKRASSAVRAGSARVADITYVLTGDGWLLSTDLE